MTIEAVLFDLDGTLVDTAPDLVRVLNDMLRERSLAPMPYAVARNEVSNGAIGLIRLGFGSRCNDSEISGLVERFRECYMRNICLDSMIFSSFHSIFDDLHEKQRPWGIVTNKPQAMTDALLARLDIDAAPGCVIGGDRLAERKPHPAPLHLAAAELGVAADRCVYVGDSPNDIEAGRAAGMRTVAAAYGYIRPNDNPHGWGADAVASHSRDIMATLARLDATLR